MKKKRIRSVKTKQKTTTIKRAGFIALSATTIAGMTASNAFALEEGAQVTQETNTQMEYGLNTEEAEQAVAAAQDNYIQASENAAAAEQEWEAAQEAVDAAQENYDSAVAAVEGAFRNAEQEAQENNDHATSETEYAEKVVFDAEASWETAQDEVENAANDVQQAQQELEDTQENCPVTQEDITKKEASYAEDLRNADIAEQELRDTETKVDNAEKILNGKLEEIQDSAGRKDAVEIDYQNAVDEVTRAQEEADRCSTDLQNCEDLRNGTIAIEDTEAYKDKQAAEGYLDQAEADQTAAADQAETAAAEYEIAAKNLENAETDYSEAVINKNDRQEEADRADADWKAAEAMEKMALNDYDQASQTAQTAENNYNQALVDKETADADLAIAIAAQTEAEEKADADEESLAVAVQNANNEVDSRLVSANTAIVVNQEALAAANIALENAQANYSLGSLGFIDWMMKKEGLSVLQQQDLQFAREILMNATEEEFSKWAHFAPGILPEERNDKVIVIGDELDATNLDNMQVSLNLMKEINELRAGDDNFTGTMTVNPAGTNFYFMAVAQAGAMRGAELLRHSLLCVSCENLAWIPVDTSNLTLTQPDPYNTYGPNYLWYTTEKEAFDRYKEELGITELTNRSQVTQIAQYARKIGEEVGHYTNLFYAADQVMGVGYTPYRDTSCYNASNAEYYTNNNVESRAMHVYSLEEFESLYNEYVKTVDKKEYENAVVTAQGNLDQALVEAETIEASREDYINNVTTDARTAAESSRKAAEEAAVRTAVAVSVVSAKEETVALTEADKEATISEAERLLSILESAQEESNSKKEISQNANTLLEEALNKFYETQAALESAKTAEETAKIILDEKNEELELANTALDDALAAYEKAVQRFDNLTSDETMEALTTAKDVADAELANAISNKEVKEALIEEAELDLAVKQAEAEAAQALLDEVKNSQTNAQIAYDSAVEKASQTETELNGLYYLYAPVAEAIQKKIEAETRLTEAQGALIEAEANLEAAKALLEGCKTDQEISTGKLAKIQELLSATGIDGYIDDEEYDYLNEYTSSVREKGDILTQLKSLLEEADLKVESLRSERDEAYVDYLAAGLLLKMILEEKSNDSTQIQYTTPASVDFGYLGYYPIPAVTTYLPYAEDVSAETDVFTRVLRFGMSGKDVAVLQQKLLDLGYLSGSADGSFGPFTLGAVRAYQEMNGLEVDGIAGPLTLASMYETPVAMDDVVSLDRDLHYGMNGVDVFAVQKVLADMGYLSSAPDGIFGNDTYNAVKYFCQDNDIIGEEGVVDQQVVAKLNEEKIVNLEEDTAF